MFPAFEVMAPTLSKTQRQRNVRIAEKSLRPRLPRFSPLDKRSMCRGIPALLKHRRGGPEETPRAGKKKGMVTG